MGGEMAVEGTRSSHPRHRLRALDWPHLTRLAREGGVLSRPDVRRRLLFEGGEERLRPLLPPRAGHLALLLASGALTGLVVCNERGHRLLLRGSTSRATHTCCEDGKEYRNEHFAVRIDALDLDGGQYLRLYGDGADPGELTAFLSSIRDSLAQEAARALRPVIDRISPEEQEGLPPLLRPPLGMQGPAVVALAQALKEGRRALVVGEQGCGKTFISLAAAYAAGCRRLLVLCPPHLARKWAREVRLTIPGATVVICRRPSDLEKGRSLAQTGRPVVCIVTREVAKLHYERAPEPVKRLAIARDARSGRAVLLKMPDGSPKRAPACPRCFAYLSRDGEAGRLPSRCPLCDEVLLSCRAGRGPRRYALAKYVARRMRGAFDCLIIDEAHEYRSADSLQAAAALTLASAIPRAICLTGTLLGGYASHLYNILFIISPTFRERYSPWEGGRSRFVRDFGLRSAERASRWERARYRPRPGVSPAVTPWLLERGVYLRLEEVVQLPPLQEEAMVVEPSPELRRAVLQLERRARERLEALPSRSHATAAIMHSLLSFPDLAWAGEEVMDPTSGELLLRAAPLQGVLPKEEALISLVQEEVREGRPCLVYVTYTGTRDVTARLVALLREAGIAAEALRAEAVPPERREAWLLARMAAGIQALVCQPRLVALGLDLVHFPTLVFFQPEADLFVMRQAARRSYRIGQTRPVRVVYMAYRESAQELLLALLARKAAASLLLEGEAVGGGLLHLSEEEALRELARLVREGGGEDVREALGAAAAADAWASSRPGWEGAAPSPAAVAVSRGLQLALPGF